MSVECGSSATAFVFRPRQGITAEKAFGVSMAKIQALGRAAGLDQELELWATGW
jgi:hypothetical protein